MDMPPSRKRREQILRFKVFDARGIPSAEQVLDFRGALTRGFERTGEYERSENELVVRWDGREPVVIDVHWREPGYGPAYLLLDHEGRGYASGGARHLNADLARASWRHFDRAWREWTAGPGFVPSRPLLALRRAAGRAIARLAGSRGGAPLARAAAAALPATLAAWEALLKEHGRAFARAHRDQFILGAMLTEPFPDAWQYSVERMFSDYEQRLALAKRQGLDAVGICFLWRDDLTFSRPESFAPYDVVVDAARRLGLEVMGMVLDSFDYKTHQHLSDEEFVEVSAAQARNLTEHFRGRLRYWTVTDETNARGFLPHSFQARLEAGNAAARAIKAVDPEAVTLATLFFDEDLLPLLARLKAERAIAREVDVIALSLFHHLGPGSDLVYRALHELFPEKRLAVGETGYIAGKDCDLIYSAPLNYSCGLGGGFWWYHWDGMIDRALDGRWYPTRFYREIQALAEAIGPRRIQGEPPREVIDQLASKPSELFAMSLEFPAESEYARAARRGARWLLESGVFDVRRGMAWGEMCSGRGSMGHSSVEVTGRVLPVFLREYWKSREPAWLEAARDGAKWLAGRQTNGKGGHGGAILDLRSKTAWSRSTALALDALLDVYFATGEEEFLEAAERAGMWLLGRMQNADGSFKAAYDVKSRRFMDGDRDDWRHSRAFGHARIAGTLLKLWEAVKETEPAYQQAAIRALAWALKFQNYDGSFKGHYSPRRRQASDEKNVSSLCEGAEGLFSACVQLLRHPRDIALHPVYLEAVKKFGSWLKDYAQFPDGSLPVWVHGDDSREGAGTLPTAQAVRLWVRLDLVTREANWLEAAARAGDFLLRMQVPAESGQLSGGFMPWASRGRSLTTSTSATAIAVLALDELGQVLAAPDLKLDPTAPRYTGFDPLL
jgi:hypothetical protein